MALCYALAGALYPSALALGKGYGAGTAAKKRVGEAQCAIVAHDKTNRACTHGAHTLYLSKCFMFDECH